MSTCGFVGTSSTSSNNAEWRFATRETFVAATIPYRTACLELLDSLPVVHNGHERAVNRLPPRGSPSRHGAQLAHESTVELSHSSSHGAKRQSCHAGKSISVVRRNALWHSLASGS